LVFCLWCLLLVAGVLFYTFCLSISMDRNLVRGICDFVKAIRLFSSISPCSNKAIILSILILFGLLLKLQLTNQLHLIFIGHCAINNDAFYKTIHLTRSLPIGLFDIFAPRLVPHEGFESYYLIFYANLENKSLNRKRVWLCYRHITKKGIRKIRYVPNLRQVKVQHGNLIAIFFVKFVDQVFYHVWPVIKFVQVAE
jgi:hypothetical protein